MKSRSKILLALMLCLLICQTNLHAQGIKGLFKKAKDAVTGKAGGTDAVTSDGPAKPLAPDVKNSISQIRAYLGLTKEEFVAKMKNLGFVEGVDEVGMGLDGQIYKSKSAGYLLAVKYGTRGKSTFVREISKGTETKNPVLAKTKTTFLDLGKQATDLKATFGSGSLKGIGEFKSSKVEVKNSGDWNSKLLPEFDKFISSKAEGFVVQRYSEKDYDYSVTYFYRKMLAPSAVIIVFIVDKTLESLEG